METTSFNGREIWQITNKSLAVCLLSVGVPMLPDDECTVCEVEERSDFKRQPVDRPTGKRKRKFIWNFESHTKDRMLKTEDMVRAFGQDMKFMSENTGHPFAIAMAVVKNLDAFSTKMATAKAYVGFRAPKGRAVLWVVENSKKHKRCLDRGMIQV